MIYLDNAATSYPKPPSVIRAMMRCMEHDGGNAGRGSHPLAMRAAERIYECRCEVAAFFGASSPADVIFTANTTMALNMVIKGLLREGDHVLISDLEHNAVYRPIAKLANEGRITYGIYPSMVEKKDRTASQICTAIEAMIRPNTRMVICTHASNICSATMPIAEIGALCHRCGVLFAVDAAQSAGHIPIDVTRMQIDALCAPGHKGLLGPQGSGVLVISPRVSAETLMEGGSGYNSLEWEMPAEPPERYEAGTLATPAIAGLCEGIRTVNSIGVARIGRQVSEWCHTLQERLERIPNVTVYLPHHTGSILLFNLDGIGADLVGRELGARGICVRTGYHCSALGHGTLQTPHGGAVRVSPGYQSAHAEISALVRAIEVLRGELR